MIDSPQIIQTEARPTAGIRLIVTPDEMQQVFGPSIAELMAAIEIQGIRAAGPVFAHHFRHPTDTFDFELGVPVARPIAASGRVQPGEWTSMRVARTVYHGPYDGLPGAWGEFMAWIEGQGHSSGPDLWESYLTNPESDPDPKTWRTELMRPLTG